MAWGPRRGTGVTQQSAVSPLAPPDPHVTLGTATGGTAFEHFTEVPQLLSFTTTGTGVNGYGLNPLSHLPNSDSLTGFACFVRHVGTSDLAFEGAAALDADSNLIADSIDQGSGNVVSPGETMALIRSASGYMLIGGHA